MPDPLPLTSSDLHVIAAAVDAVEATPLASNDVLGRVEVYRPGGDDRIGWVTRFDPAYPEMGWGYVPEVYDR